MFWSMWEVISLKALLSWSRYLTKVQIIKIGSSSVCVCDWTVLNLCVIGWPEDL
jgi:hypothetical protein